MSGPLLCGIDAGTGSIRALILEPSGSVQAAASVPTPTDDEGEGRASYDAERLWQACASALGQALDGLGPDRHRVKAIAVASMGETGVLIDREGQALCPMIAWFDTRTKGTLASILARCGRDAIHGLTGLCPDPTFSALKIRWLIDQDPATMDHAVRWLHVSEYLAFRLSGVVATDLSLASRTMLLDLTARRWSSSLADQMGIDPALLPPIRPSGDRLGRINPGLAGDLAIAGDCVIGVGGHDHLCGMLAVGADRPGHLLDSMGTAEGLTLVVDRPHLRASVEAKGLNQGVIETKGGDPAYYMFGGLPTSAAAIEWFQQTMAPGLTREILIERAGGLEPAADDPLFFPQLRLGSPPYPDPVARGGFVGLAAHTSIAALYRAVLEGIALDGDQILCTMTQELAAGPPEQVTAIGGSSQNRLLMQLKAGLMGRRIAVAETHDATAIGAAMLAGLAMGLYVDMADARGQLAVKTRALGGLQGWSDEVTARRRLAYAKGKALLRGLHSDLLDDD